MNLASSVAIYAAVNKELTGELEFPGPEKFYNMFDCFTDSKIHAEFNKWAALEPKCGNQFFNIHNGDQESWSELWPKVAKKYGCRVPPIQFERPKPDPSVMELAEVPPYEDLAPSPVWKAM
jgi:nucleoside-diphosphate-sugar epimerase